MPTGFDWFNRLSLAVAGILGAAGVAAAATASHTGEARILGALALVALTQAPAVLALAVFAGTGWLVRAATISIGLGALIFSADLASRHFTGGGLLPNLAPLGGVVMIAGWTLLVPAALVGRRN